MQEKRGRTGDAVACYKTALRPRPNYSDVHESLGALLLGQRQIDEAILHLRAASDEAPDNGYAHFETITKQVPNDAEAQMNLGVALARAGHRDEAISHVKEALRLRPDQREASLELQKLGARTL